MAGAGYTLEETFSIAGGFAAFEFLERGFGASKTVVEEGLDRCHEGRL